MSNSSERIQSVKELVLDNQLFIDVIRKKKSNIEKDYNDYDKVKEEFLLTMLSRGYIDENYSDFLSESYEGQFTNDEFAYIQNLKEEREPDFKLKIEHFHSVERKILPYKWTNASVLNNDILSNALKNEQTEKIKKIIKAIINYSRLYKKNDFLEQYVNSIINESEKDKLIDNFLAELSEELDSDSLSIFSEKTVNLFYKMLDKKIDDTTIREHGKIIEDFLENNTKILDGVLVKAVQNPALKEKIKKINIEVNDLSDYNDKNEVQRMLIDDALFRITKENLDLILSQQKELEPGFYYDYIRRRPKIKNKINDADKINDYIDIMFPDKEIRNISEEGLADLLFATIILDEKAEQIISRLANVSVDLTYLPRYYDLNTKHIIKINSNLIHFIIKEQKIKWDFSNLLFVSQSDIVDDVISFAYHQLAVQKRSRGLSEIDNFAKINYLESFYTFLLTEPKVDLDLLEGESIFLIRYGFDVINLANPLVNGDKEIPPSKMQKLIELAFKRINIRDESSMSFSSILKKEFDYFLKNCYDIKSKCRLTWTPNFAVLLRNENNILDESQVDSLMGIVTLEEFGIIIKNWIIKDGKQVVSNYIKKLLSLKNLSVWTKQFGRSAVVDFLDNYKESLDGYVVNEIKANIEQNFNSSINHEPVENETSHIKTLLNITEKYNLPPRVIFERRIKSVRLFEHLVAALQYDSQNALNWNMINHIIRDIIHHGTHLQVALDIIKNHPDSSEAKRNALVALSPNGLNRAAFGNDLFIVGRYFYNAMEKRGIEVSEFCSFEDNDLLKISSIFPLHPLLCGAVFEGYFDNGGNLKNSSSDVLFRLSCEIGNDRNSKGYEFIRECLAPFRYDLRSDIASIFNL